MSEKSEKLIDKKGVRLDGRKPDELRPIKLEVGVLSNADGSAYIEQGEKQNFSRSLWTKRTPS